jgi:hypothetical protein
VSFLVPGPGSVPADDAAQNEDDFDAAEIDRELIASRLQKDVVGV